VADDLTGVGDSWDDYGIGVIPEQLHVAMPVTNVFPTRSSTLYAGHESKEVDHNNRPKFLLGLPTGYGHGNRKQRRADKRGKKA
jgi:hypothetical protein